MTEAATLNRDFLASVIRRFFIRTKLIIVLGSPCTFAEISNILYNFHVFLVLKY